ncbi:hypothetical protein [Pendulispora albinea]|uniref:Delta-60 repeat protein n=1 Tax=Pendulispora albinea TaxID=2741071 RepID=A0ABZ2LX02_9BACT
MDDRLLGVAFDTSGNAFAVGIVKHADGGADFSPAVVKFLPTGEIDTTFGNNGVAVVPAVVGQGSNFRGIGVQSTGKIVIAGTVPATVGLPNDRDVGVIRLNADGKSLDSTFAPGSATPGVRVIDLAQGNAPTTDGGLPTARDDQYGLNIQPGDDKIIVVGAQRRTGGTDTDFAVIRLNANGTNDPTFSGDGVFTLDIDQLNVSARRATVLADGGGVVVSGYVPGSTSPFAPTRPVLFKLTSAGELDPSFGPDGGGIYSEPVLSAVTEIYGIAQQGARFVTAGYGKSDPANAVPTDVVSLRFGSSGTLDRSYATDGYALVKFTPNASNGRAVTVLGDNRIVIVGNGQATAGDSDGFVAILSENGRPDTTFGAEGRRTYNLGGKGDQFADIARFGNRLAIVGFSATLDAGNENGYALFLTVP